MKMISFRALLLMLCVMPNAASAEDWGCYDPKPGHPTLKDKKAFVAELVPNAQEAERKFGVPAPAKLAMASLESGFGFTRIALNANNLFEWKYYSAASAGNRQAWVFGCLPEEDHNNKYVKFSSRDEAMNFVAMKLATLERYHTITISYRAQRSQGDGILEAINSWVDSVDDAGYNLKPDEYKRTLKAILINYLNPGVESQDFNLYQYAVDPPSASD
jgi:uncharacterized FlgJ-related protein